MRRKSPSFRLSGRQRMPVSQGLKYEVYYQPADRPGHTVLFCRLRVVLFVGLAGNNHMEHSLGDIGKTPLDEYVKVVANIYSTHDRYRSIWDVWCHTLHHAAGITEQIRKGRTEGDLYIEIADFSLWFFTAILKLSGKFGELKSKSETPEERFMRIQGTCSDLLWHKYPKICPSCYARRLSEERTGNLRPDNIGPCDCRGSQPGSVGQEAKRRYITDLRHYSQQIEDEKPTTVDEWQSMFRTVFANNLAILSLTDIVLHLMEELGEVSDAMIRMYSYKQKDFLDGEPNWRQSNLEAQLADVFSWLFALVGKLDSAKEEKDLKHKGQDPDGATKPRESVRLSEIIWGRYGSEEKHSFCCQSCKGSVCTCSIILVPATRPGEELLQKFK